MKEVVWKDLRRQKKYAQDHSRQKERCAIVEKQEIFFVFEKW